LKIYNPRSSTFQDDKDLHFFAIWEGKDSVDAYSDFQEVIKDKMKSLQKFKWSATGRTLTFQFLFSMDFVRMQNWCTAEENSGVRVYNQRRVRRVEEEEEEESEEEEEEEEAEEEEEEEEEEEIRTTTSNSRNEESGNSTSTSNSRNSAASNRTTTSNSITSAKAKVFCLLCSCTFAQCSLV